MKKSCISDHERLWRACPRLSLPTASKAESLGRAGMGVDIMQALVTSLEHLDRRLASGDAQV